MIEPRELLARVLDAWRRGDAFYAAAHFEPDAVYQEAGRPPLVGRSALADHFTRFFRDGPRWRLEVDAMLVEGSRAAVVYRFALEGEPGRWHERAGCAVVTFREGGGTIAAWREYEG